MRLQSVMMSTEQVDDSSTAMFDPSRSFLDEKTKVTIELEIEAVRGEVVKIAPSVGGLISLLMSIETAQGGSQLQFPDEFPAPVAGLLFDAMRALDEEDWSEIRRAEANSGPMYDQFHQRDGRPMRLEAIVSVALAAVIRKAAGR